MLSLKDSLYFLKCPLLTLIKPFDEGLEIFPDVSACVHDDIVKVSREMGSANEFNEI